MSEELCLGDKDLLISEGRKRRFIFHCEICNLDFGGVQSHLYWKHHLSSKEYYDQYLKKVGDDKCIICGTDTKFGRISGGGYTRHCTKCVSKDPHIKAKKVETCKLNYNTDNPMKDNNIKNKLCQNNLNKYGKSWPMQRFDVQERRRNSCFENNGVEYPLQLQKFKNQYVITCRSHFDTDWPMQSLINQEKSKCTFQNKYGVDNFSQTPEGRKISSKNFVKMVELAKSRGEPIVPRIGYTECVFLDELEKYINYKISRNVHFVINKKIRFPDGYIPELKLFIQFDEKQHFKDKEMTIYKQDDIDCTLQLASLGYVVYRVSKKDWITRPYYIIDQFKQLVLELGVN